MTAGDQPRAAPFVGPRPYRIGEQLFGRDRERLDLLDLLIAERIVLLYSPSGAGKTSLVQAALVPALRDEKFTVPAVARVTFERATGISEPVANRYVFAVLLSLEEAQPKEQQIPLADLARMTISDYLDQRWGSTAHTGGMVLIIDQFEEVLTIDPTDTQAKTEFFAQLGAALLDPHRWALCSMREEHVAGLDPYRNLIPTRFSSTFRLDLLDERQARQAMQEISAQAGVTFADDAARKLADDLRRVHVERPGGGAEERLGPTVEPTQLQVVCLGLWGKLTPDKTRIEESDVEAFGSADTALAEYYAQAVARLETNERKVRDWIEDELITPQRLRNQVLREEALRSGRIDANAISLLDERHLIRQERRRGITWLELAHDRLVEPIERDNAAWREVHLTPFQRQAALWDKQGRPGHLAIRGRALSAAKRWANEHGSELTPVEANFLLVCMQRRRSRTAFFSTYIVTPAFLGIIATGYFYLQWLQTRPWAFLTNLITDQSFNLDGAGVPIGRTVEDVKNRISLPQLVVSRRHLEISRDLQAQDMRSLNGTTVNGRFLQYGTERKLEDGDLITLAGVASFLFSIPESSVIPFLSPSRPPPSPASGAWAVLVDGGSKKAIPISGSAESDYFIGDGEDGNLSFGNSRDGGSLLKVTFKIGDNFRDMAFETLDTSDRFHLFAMFKYEDRNYFAVGIPAGVRVSEFLKTDSGEQIVGTEYLSKMSFCFGQSSQGKTITLHGVETRALPVDSDEEPNCALGPFQIVLF